MGLERTCPHCGKPVPPSALQGICPECMLKAGLGAETVIGENGPHGTQVVPPSSPSPAEIASLFPQLEILELLGCGGMGVVYKARQPKLNRLVALKILPRDKEKDPSFAERFAREARALARLNHPNIVTVHDFGETDGLCYLVMEFVDGLNLRQMLRRGAAPPEQALAIVPRICEALQYAHEQGIVHRDIKPENILLDKAGRVKIADFGIAKMVRPAGGPAEPLPPELQTLTGENMVVGTPRYMAPEQLENPQHVDHRADIYSLGVVFYEMLTGELPLGRFQPPSSKVRIDVRLDEVVLHALEKEPERRYQHASEVKTAVDTIAATPSGSGVKLPVGPRRAWQWMAGVGGALLAGALLVYLLPTRAPNVSTAPDLARTPAAEPIPGWFESGSRPQDYEMKLDRQTTHSGKASPCLRSIVPHPAGSGVLMQMFQADDYRGKRVRFSGFLRSKDVQTSAGLLLRIDGPNSIPGLGVHLGAPESKMLSYQNTPGYGLRPEDTDKNVLSVDAMEDRPVKGTTEWKKCEIVLDVPEASLAIAMGLRLIGAGQVWMDDLKFETVGTDVATTGMKPEPRLPRAPQLNFTK